MHWFVDMHFHLLLIAQLLVLLIVANGAPIVAARILGQALAVPFDGGLVFVDGRPLFGSSKTLRGIALSVLITTVTAPLIGLDWRIGTLFALMAMSGDLISSFLKRRMGIAPSDRAIGLDQIPESLLPLLACAFFLPLTFLDVAITTAIFSVGGLALSRILYKLHVRDRPY